VVRNQRNLQRVLAVVGLLFIVVPATLMVLWPGGWRWKPHNADYEMMMVGVYATLGLFLLLAAQRPADHQSLVRFTIVSSFVHGATMTGQGFEAGEHGHLIADGPVLLLIACALLVAHRAAFPGEPVLPRLRITAKA
jgi:hypothetical protein